MRPASPSVTALRIALFTTASALAPMPATGEPCPRSTAHEEGIRAARRAGLLHQALDRAEALDRACPSSSSRLALAEVLADLGLDAQAITAWHDYERLAAQELAGEFARWSTAQRPGPKGATISAARRAQTEQAITDAQSRAAQEVAALRRRPPPSRKATAAEREEALAHYREGVELRLRGEFKAALASLRRSYALSPHPLTITQIALTHGAAGSEDEARRSTARALVIAELTQQRRAEARLTSGHRGPIRAVAVSPDERLIATGGADRVVKIWEAHSGREQATLVRHNGAVNSLAFSPDRTWLASGGDDGHVHLWEVATGRLARTLPAHDDAVSAIRFDRAGRWLISAGWDGAVKRWEVTTGHEKNSRWLGGGPCRALDLHEASGLLVVAVEGQLRLLDYESWRERRAITHDDQLQIAAPYLAVAISPDGRLIAAADARGGIDLFDPEGTPVASPDGHFAAAHSLHFTTDGAALRSAGDDDAIREWTIPGGAPRRPLLGPTGIISALAPTTGALLVSAGYDGTVTLWDPAAGRPLRSFGHTTEPLAAVAFSPDGGELASASQDGTIARWSLGPNSSWSVEPDPVDHQGAIKMWSFGPKGSVLTWRGHDAGVSALAYHPRRALLASGGSDGTVHLWDLAKGGSAQAGPAHRGRVSALAFDAGHEILASGGVDGEVRLRRLGPDGGSGGPVDQPLRHDGPVASLAFFDDGRVVAAADAKGIVKAWSTGDGRAWTARLPGPFGVSAGLCLDEGCELPASGGTLLGLRPRAVTAGQGLLAVGSDEGTIKLAGRRALLLAGHVGAVNSLALHPRRPLLASASDDGTVRLWDAERGWLLAILLATAAGEWLVLDPEGRVDGSPGDRGGRALLYWQVGEVKLPGFVGWERQATPGLLGELLGPRPPRPGNPLQ